MSAVAVEALGIQFDESRWTSYRTQFDNPIIAALDTKARRQHL